MKLISWEWGWGVGTKAEGKSRPVGGCGRVCEGGWWSRLEFNQGREWEAGSVKNMFYWGGDMSNITVSVRSAESRLRNCRLEVLGSSVSGTYPYFVLNHEPQFQKKRQNCTPKPKLNQPTRGHFFFIIFMWVKLCYYIQVTS